MSLEQAVAIASRNVTITKYHYHERTIVNMIAISCAGLALPSDGIRNSQF